MLVTLQELLKESPGAIASFNCVDFDMARSCIRAAEENGASVIIGVATRHWNVVGGTSFIPSLVTLCEESSSKVALHLDHASEKELGIISDALVSGFTSIMIDGSKLSFEENMKITKKVVDMAKPYGASVEGELGPILGDEGVAGLVDASKSLYTNPLEAEEFCSTTGVDALAIAVGTAHGIYKDTPKLQQELISEIAGLLDGIPLVLHGATGIPDEAINEAVKRGVKKINFFSGLLVSAMDEVRKCTDEEDNDYVGLKKRMMQSWQSIASDMIRLYRGH